MNRRAEYVGCMKNSLSLPNSFYCCWHLSFWSPPRDDNQVPALIAKKHCYKKRKSTKPNFTYSFELRILSDPHTILVRNIHSWMVNPSCNNLKNSSSHLTITPTSSPPHLITKWETDQKKQLWCLLFCHSEELLHIIIKLTVFMRPLKTQLHQLLKDFKILHIRMRKACSMLLQHQMALDLLLASQGGICHITGFSAPSLTEQESMTSVTHRLNSLLADLRAQDTSGGWDWWSWLTFGRWFVWL